MFLSLEMWKYAKKIHQIQTIPKDQAKKLQWETSPLNNINNTPIIIIYNYKFTLFRNNTLQFKNLGNAKKKIIKAIKIFLN